MAGLRVCTGRRRVFDHGLRRFDFWAMTPRGRAGLSTGLLCLLACYASGMEKPLQASAGHSDLVRRLDHVVQARFQSSDAGKFGPDRFQDMFVEGHVSVTGLVNLESSPEVHMLKPLRNAPYSVIVGILHVRHKPGSFSETPGMSPSPHDPLPSSDVLEATGTSRRDAERAVVWGIAHIEPATLRAANRVKRGEAVDYMYRNYSVAIRPVRAGQATCLSCHTGSKRGDVLGAMIYMVTPTPGHAPAKAVMINGHRESDD